MRSRNSKLTGDDMVSMGNRSRTLPIAVLLVLAAVVGCSHHHAASTTPPGAEGFPAYWGYIDREGRIRVSARFSGARDFRTGRAVVCEGSVSKRSYGVIDENGSYVVPPQWTFIGDFTDDGRAFVEQDGLKGMVDRSGRLLNPLTREDLKFSDLYSERVGILAKGFRFVDKFSEGCAVIQTERDGGMAYGYIDTTGKVVCPPRYAVANRFSEGLAKVCTFEDTGMSGFIDRHWNVVIQPQYTEAHNFHDGLARVKRSGMAEDEWEYIDKAGKTVIHLRCQYAGDFHDGRALVNDSRSVYWYIDTCGKRATPAQFDEAEDFREGLAAVAVPNMRGDIRWGFIDISGRMVIPARFWTAKHFSEGLAAVRLPPEAQRQ